MAQEIADGVWLGRCPRRGQWTGALVDVTAELPVTPRKSEYRNVPMLDLRAQSGKVHGGTVRNKGSSRCRDPCGFGATPEDEQPTSVRVLISCGDRKLAQTIAAHIRKNCDMPTEV